MSLAGMAHQSFLELRRKLLKPNIPDNLMKHFDTPPENSSMLFCDALEAAAEEINTNQKSKDKGKGKKRPAPQDFRQGRAKSHARPQSSGPSTLTRPSQQYNPLAGQPVLTYLPSGSFPNSFSVPHQQQQQQQQQHYQQDYQQDYRKKNTSRGNPNKRGRYYRR